MTTTSTQRSADARVADARQAIDLDSALARVDGDSELLVEVLDMFAEQSVQLLGELETGLTARDDEAVYRHAHTLKGSASSISAAAVEAAALRIEMAGRQGDFAGAQALLPTLKRAIADAATAIGPLKQVLSRTAT